MKERYNVKWKRCEKAKDKPFFLNEGETETYYLMDYQRGSPNFEEAPPGNTAVQNLKKKPTERGKPDYKYKAEEIKSFACKILKIVVKDKEKTIFCSMPTSNPRHDSEYDSRLDDIVDTIGKSGFRAENNLKTKKKTDPLHQKRGVRDPEQIKKNTEFTRFHEPVPSTIFLVDDVITSGAHYKACNELIKAQYPKAKIVGLFLAKTLSE
jgi:predicted amidophosphoribosyltransferase